MKSIERKKYMTSHSTVPLCFYCAGILSFSAAFCQTPSNTVPKLSDTTKTAGLNPALKPDTVKKAFSDSAVKPDTLAQKTSPDSLKRNLPPLQPSIGEANVPKQTPAPAPNTMDTTYCFWYSPYWGIGAGWGLGSFPIFTEWIKGLPDSSQNIIGPDTALKNFSVKEPADAYTILVPVTLYWTPFADERHSLSFEGSFFWISKTFQAYLQGGDTATARWIHWQQSMSAYSFSFGLNYKYNIPEQYFRVENVNRTSLLLGFSADPLLLVDKSASFSSSGLADSTLAKVNKAVDNRSFKGIGCAWRVGFSSLHRLSTAKGVEIGIIYSGRWYGYFKSGKTRTTWKDINPGSSSPQETVSFLSNTFQITFALVSGKKPAR